MTRRSLLRRRVSRERPRVVHITTTDMSLDWLLGPQLRAFAASGYEVIGMSAAGEHVANLTAIGIEHVDVAAFTRSNNPVHDLRAFGQLVRLLHELQPDIVHTHNPKPGILGRIAARLTRTPLVVNTQHGLWAQPTDRWQRRLPVYAAERTAAAFGDVELVQNPEDVATLVDTLHVPARRVRLLGNGVDLERFDPSRFGAAAVDPAAVDPAAVDPAAVDPAAVDPAAVDPGRVDPAAGGAAADGAAAGGADERRRLRAEWGIGDDEVLCLVVGRLVREKGIVELLEAAHDLHERGVAVRLVVVGPTDPDKSDAIEHGVFEQAAVDGVVLTGTRTDMPECYAAADIFLTASWREGFPRSAMEAAAMGLPTIATDIRGNRQVIADGETGLLVGVRDPAGIAAAVERLVDDAELRSDMAAAARRRAVAEFDQQQIIDRTLDAYGLLAR